MAASITITRQVNQPYGDYESTLISAFAQTSLEFRFNHDGEVDSFAKVWVNGVDFLAVVKTYDILTNTDLYYFDITEILPSILGFGSNPYNMTSDLMKEVVILCKGYDSEGNELATATHPTIQLSFCVPPISRGNDFYDYIYKFGQQYGKIIYYTDAISFYWMHASGTYPFSIGGVSKNYAVEKGYNLINLDATQKGKSGAFTSIGSGRLFEINLIFANQTPNQNSISWVNREGSISSWYFRDVTSEHTIKKENEVSIYAEENRLTYSKKRTISGEKTIRIAYDTIAYNADHFAQLVEIAESPIVFINQVYQARVIAATNILATCKQKLKFNLTLEIDDNAVSY